LSSVPRGRAAQDAAGAAVIREQDGVFEVILETPPFRWVKVRWMRKAGYVLPGGAWGKS
jgi:hypothetical protein